MTHDDVIIGLCEWASSSCICDVPLLALLAWALRCGKFSAALHLRIASSTRSCTSLVLLFVLKEALFILWLIFFLFTFLLSCCFRQSYWQDVGMLSFAFSNVALLLHLVTKELEADDEQVEALAENVKEKERELSSKKFPISLFGTFFKTIFLLAACFGSSS